MCLYQFMMALHFLNDVANHTKIDNHVKIASLKSETMEKLINRIPGSRLWYQVYQAWLKKTNVELLSKPPDSTSVLEALPGILDTKRHSPSILYLYHDVDKPLVVYIICSYWLCTSLHNNVTYIWQILNLFIPKNDISKKLNVIW